MDRRETLKSIALGSLVGGLALQSCVSNPNELTKKVWEYQYGRTPEEKEGDSKNLNNPFFAPEEDITLRVLANLILPPNEKGSIEKAKVPEFIAFMVNDYPDFQIPIRGGLMSLNNHCNTHYGKIFTDCTVEEQKEVLDGMAYPVPDLPNEEQSQPVQFFSLVKNLVMTGYFTSKVGIEELGYKGNRPNVWDGVPGDVLKQYEKEGVGYSKEWLDKCIDQSTRDEIAQWDDDGNLIA